MLLGSDNLIVDCPDRSVEEFTFIGARMYAMDGDWIVNSV